MNRLETEISPYLLEHASNPVDWQPWDEIALLRAKEENKPIFLSIGYSACHWCHVMAGESFSNKKVASILNQNFISIKVDREERPDIDKIYMDALVSMTGHGGWPLSAFLTPDGYPFYMGTYFPLYPKHGLPGFIDILTRIAGIYAENSTELKRQSIELSKNFVNSGIFQTNTGERSETSSVSKILTNIFKNFDFTNGGWGSQPKFPNSLVLMLLLDKQFYSQDLSSSVIELTLNRMAQGGFYDIVRGGFHRYSTDKNWLIPHFEKMLYDNALLATTYLFAGQKSNNEKFLSISKRILDFMKIELLSPNEGFWSSLDADSEGKEGNYYIWSQEEIINSFTPEEYEIIRGVFVLDNSVLFENKYILRFRNDYTENFFEEKFRLNQKYRVRPNTDDKLLVDWNSLAISAFAKAGLFLQNEEYKEIAIRVLEFILSNLYLDNRLYHSYRLGKIGKIGLLSDYSFLLNALIDVFLIDHNYRWLEIAFQICDEMVDLFWDGKQFFDTGVDDSGLILRPQTLEDSVIPSGWSMAILAIQKINIFRVQEKYTEIVSSSINKLLQIIQNNPNFYPVWLKNLYVLNNMPETVVLIKENDTLNESINIEQQILQIINPDTILLSLNANSKLFGVLDLLKGKSTTGNQTTIYLCTHNTCSQPLNTIDEFIEEFRIRNQTSTNAL